MTRPSLLLAGIAALLLHNLPVFALQAASQRQELIFQVWLDDEPIGMHSFRFTTHASHETVDIRADFDVTFLTIPVYSYDHRNRETWSNGCLEMIEAYTDNNGDEYRVHGQRSGAVFELITLGETTELQNDCVMSFAYWDQRILRQNKLLNAQNGDYLPVETKAAGTEQLQLGHTQVSARRYDLRNQDKGIDISIWYGIESGHWLSLESRVDGRVIRYLPTQ